MITIFFLQRRMGGGTTTFTAHLAEGLSRIHQDVSIVRVRCPGETTRLGVIPFGEYDHEMWTVTPEEALKLAKSGPSIIAASTNLDRLPSGLMRGLQDAGTLPVIHDLTQRKLYPKYWSRFICIRKSMEAVIPGARYIGHPYVRQMAGITAGKKARSGAISTARVDSSKRTHLILRANRLLPKNKRIKIMGSEFRLYSYGLAKRYSDVFKQSGHALNWPLAFAPPVVLCAGARYNVDLTRFPQDGGGTQYTQLEAMDAGCINIMHEDWFKVKGDMQAGVHAIAVSTPEELADAVVIGGINNGMNIEPQIREAGYKLLAQHDAKKIAKKYLEALK